MTTSGSAPHGTQSAPGAVTLVTVLHNSSDILRGFIESAIAACSGSALSIVAVDNESADRETSRAIAEELGVQFLAMPQNRGYGSGANAGAAQAARPGEYVLVCNPDVVFEAHAIDVLRAAAESSDPAVAAFGPRIVDPSGAVYPSARRLPTIRTGVGHALFARIAPNNPWTRRYRAESEYSDAPRDAEWLSGACLLIRADWFTRLGGFDERFFMYFEDVDLGARIRAAGGRSRYVPDATIVHTGAHSTSGSARRMTRVHHESAAIYFDKTHPGPLLYPLRKLVGFGLWLRARWTTRGH
ncbi:glycosyltransferase [Compostimonas suwonensis]|uniref:N-acetylglucosaminyl-diphospho-decaprenol L-rhamnosyltransferase n=1 Tax=Compostimonas suwonensis TaxID=1048394 RepID=A0A2M9BUX0_9MICO|nr:glycosyltransferase family 2 protein [Compostimonas suwonensis]PJJ61743.1 N-acetylglucosaminyl-diphospho-decaprenol L-rhamnosyltransferase [Compostimonas suwonensis]